MFCEIDIGGLNQRGGDVCQMLKPLTGQSRLAFDVISQSSQILIAVRSGPKPDLNPTDWRFTTTVREIRGAYHERWLPSDEKRQRYHLERAYLHLYRRERPEDNETEFLALHCDPNEAETSRHARYKRGPHLHINDAPQPLPHSHFALCSDYLTGVLGSVANLSAAVSSGVVMIRDQVLDIWPRTNGSQ